MTLVSRQSGFARNPSESRFPRAWQGIEAWWCPSIHPRGGNRLFDLGPKRCDGTLTNMTNSDWVVANVGGSLDFDGVDDYVDTKSIEFERTDQFTLSAWVCSRTVNNEQIINNENASYRGYQLSISPTAKLQFLLRNTPTTNFIGVVSNDSLVADRWYHLAAMYDGSSDASRVELFINGRLAESTVTGNNLTATTLSGETTWLGRRRPVSQGPLNGCLADARIYRRKLLRAECRFLALHPTIGLETQEVQFCGTAAFSAAWLSRQSTIIGGGVA